MIQARKTGAQTAKPARAKTGAVAAKRNPRRNTADGPPATPGETIRAAAISRADGTSAARIARARIKANPIAKATKTTMSTVAILEIYVSTGELGG